MSAIFKCETCQNADSIYATQQTSVGYTCSRCKDGSWHGQFPEETWNYEIHGPALNVADYGDSSGGSPSFS